MSVLLNQAEKLGCCSEPILPVRPADGFKRLRMALVGQPNCGKSTIFNSVAGYRSATANFPGTTVKLARSEVRVNGMPIELVDLPGVYSLAAENPAESAAKNFLIHEPIDLVINVVDASLLSRSLELTLELREMGVPMVVCLNMSDEARRKGMEISARQLGMLVGVPVAETVAREGLGVKNLFSLALLQAGFTQGQAGALEWDRDVESVVRTMEHSLNGHVPLPRVSKRFAAIKLLEGDPDVTAIAPEEILQTARRLRTELARTHGRPAEAVIMSERHDRSMVLFERATKIGRPKPDFRDAIDRLLMGPVTGYLCLAAILIAMFWVVFGLGKTVEDFMLGRMDSGWVFIAGSISLTKGTLAYSVLKSMWDGVAGGAGIVLPYLVPFLLMLSLLEDSGYMPRVAYLMDGLLHRIGLHGTSTVPLMIGYGCAVPSCMATRILPTKRDRFLASLLSNLVPCSARSTVIFALIAYYLGPWWALGIYAFNAVVVIASGWLMARWWPEISPGMVLEVPKYQWPSPQAVIKKTWMRMKEFVVVSWPLLVAGSIVLGLIEYSGAGHWINSGLRPLTWVLGVPAAVGVTLIFGVLRKELAMVMLTTALGTTALATVMTPQQMLVFTIFLVFYIPCVSTIAVMWKELGAKLTGLAAVYSMALALVIALATRAVLSFVL